MNGDEIYAQHAALKNKIREKMLAREEITEDDLDLYKSQYFQDGDAEDLEEETEREFSELDFEDEMDAALEESKEGGEDSDDEPFV